MTTYLLRLRDRDLYLKICKTTNIVTKITGQIQNKHIKLNKKKTIYLIYYLLSNDCLLYKYQHLILLILSQTINRCSSSYDFKNCEKWEIIHLCLPSIIFLSYL